MGDGARPQAVGVGVPASGVDVSEGIGSQVVVGVGEAWGGRSVSVGVSVAVGVGVAVGDGEGVGVEVGVWEGGGGVGIGSATGSKEVEGEPRSDPPRSEGLMVTEAADEHGAQSALLEVMVTVFVQLPAPSALTTTSSKPACPWARAGMDIGNGLVMNEHGPPSESVIVMPSAVPGPSFHQATVNVIVSPTPTLDWLDDLSTPMTGAGMGVFVTVGVTVGVFVSVGVDVTVAVAVEVGVWVGVAVPVGVAVAVGVVV